MNRLMGFIVSLLLLVSLLAVNAESPSKKESLGNKVFGTGNVLQFHLNMTEKEFAGLLPTGGPKFGPPGAGPQTFPEGDSHRNTFGVELPWSKGEVLFGGENLKDAGIRYKGNYTFMATAKALKKSIKIDFNRNLADQKLDGLTMLSFNCAVSDPSRAREAFAYSFFRNAGLPAPRTAIAELSLTVPGKYDKELVGVYTVVETVNKSFLKTHFKDGKGMLLKPEGLQGGLAYLGPSWKPYDDRYRPENSPKDKQKKRLIEFTKLISNSDDATFAKELGSFLDIDAFLKFIAVNALLANLDSYLGYGHNYYLYLVPDTNKFVFIPWDLDLSLATWPAAGMPEQQVKLSIHHPHSGKNKLIDRVFAIKEHKDQYLKIIQKLSATVFTKESMIKNLEGIENLLKEPMEKETKAVAARKETRGGGFGIGGGEFGRALPPRTFIEKRTESVASQMEGKEKGFEPMPFGFGRPPAFGPGGGVPKKGP